MDKRDLQKLLSQPYKQENWKEIVQFVFPNVSILATPKVFPINNDKIKKFCQIGSVRLNDGKNLALFELLLSDSVNIHRNRVELNNEISKYIDQEQIHGVLSIFEQGNDDYRFTFSARSTEFDEEESDFVQKKTDTKRFTYVLGKNESCKTPADRFYELSENKSEVDIIAIQHAFSVEQLSKEFFDKYKKQFDKFWSYINSNKDYKKISFGEDREKGIRDFTKKLLGRIVFLHFLQKKGWMGCTSGTSKWEDGDKQFMQNLFESFKDKTHFHSKCLAELFYSTLNRKRTDDLFICEGLDDKLNNIKVPYLNGGLFDSGEVESHKIDFPEKYFEELLEFFGQYNFTIDENDPNDHEVGIDPEMLGHIFENLLEDNKDKGAFYTPKVIVQYMCQESLIEYISTKLSVDTNSEIKEAIEELVRNRLAEKCSDLDLVESIAKALYDVKVCDPAIGSGAFPMGILNTIYQVVEGLYWIQPDSVARVWNISDTEWQPYLVKKNIIQHSIYGVDIESGAVDIARLRFWLALVVDEVEPVPLPNLDYKIMQGNSLLESFEGIDLSQIANAAAYEEVYESKQIDIFTGEAKKSKTISLKFENIKSLMNEYFNTNDSETKKKIHKSIDNQVLIHIKSTLQKHKEELSLRKNNLEKSNKSDSKIQKKLIKTSSELASYVNKEIRLSQLSNSNERPFFLWHLFFQEVFESGGFDIVIGNPPYVEHKKLKHISSQLKPIYDVYTGSSDLSVYFFEKAFNILKKGGVFCYINTNKFFNTGYGKSLRKFLLEKKINSILNFEQVEVFEGILVSSVIFCASNTSNDDNRFTYIEFCKENDWKHNFRPKIIERAMEFDQSLFNEREWVFEQGFSLDIKTKIENTGVRIKDINSIFIRRGVTTGFDPAFIIDKQTYNNLDKADIIKHLLKGGDIKKYTINFTDRFLINSHNGISSMGIRPINVEKDYPKIFKHLKYYYNEKSPGAIIKPNGQITCLKTRSDQGDVWYNLRNCAFIEQFKVSKIVWPLTADKWGFAHDDKGHFLTSGGFFMISSKISLKYLLAFLNSNLMQFYFGLIGVMTAGGAYTLKKSTIEEFPIVVSESQNEIEELVDKILVAKSKGQDSQLYEEQIDVFFFTLFKLSNEEINHIKEKTK